MAFDRARVPVMVMIQKNRATHNEQAGIALEF
jgi:hypothetical protein